MTAPQRHRILRQVVELAGCPPGEAAALQDAAARRFHQDWLPLIEQALSALGDPARVLRLDRLDIDLGTVPAQALLTADVAAQVQGGGAGPGGPVDARPPAAPGLSQHLAQCLRERLAEALRQADEVSADAELLQHFLHTGSLPWWADAADRDAVAAAARALLAQPAPAWRGWLGDAEGPAPHALARLVATLPDDALCRLCAQLRGPAPDDGWSPAQQPAWQDAMDDAARRLGQPPLAWRGAWWQALLADSLWPSAGLRDWQALLQRWWAGLAVPPQAVGQALRQAMDRPASAAATTQALPAALWQALGTHGNQGRRSPSDHPADPDGALDRALREALARVAAAGHPAALAWQSAQSLGPGPDGDALRQRIAALLARAGDAAALAEALAALGRAWVAQQPAPPEASRVAAAHEARAARAWAAALRQRPGSAGAAAAPPAGAPVPAPPRRAAAPPVLEALYLQHAGLVLLWPFIRRFADRQGLLQPGDGPARWRDEAAAQRGAVLLHCAISGDADPPEFHLPLAKLLCGLALDAPLALDRPLSETEQAECEALLVAAIAQAPILRQMSVAGFRASFGAREGRLSGQDGHWLLQVQRQAYDVVIDRFPWSVGVVRLPWMSRLLQVRW